MTQINSNNNSLVKLFSNKPVFMHVCNYLNNKEINIVKRLAKFFNNSLQAGNQIYARLVCINLKLGHNTQLVTWSERLIKIKSIFQGTFVWEQKFEWKKSAEKPKAFYVSNMLQFMVGQDRHPLPLFNKVHESSIGIFYLPSIRAISKQNFAAIHYLHGKKVGELKDCDNPYFRSIAIDEHQLFAFTLAGVIGAEVAVWNLKTSQLLYKEALPKSINTPFAVALRGTTLFVGTNVENPRFYKCDINSFV